MLRSSTIIAGLASALLVGAIMKVTSSPAQPSTSSRERELSARLDRMEADMQRMDLRQQTQPIERGLAAPRNAVDLRDDSEAQTHAGDDESFDSDTLGPEQLNDEEAARLDEAARAHFDGLGQALASEPTDSAWASRVAGNLGEGFETVGLDRYAKLVSIECRTSYCAIDLRYASDDPSSRPEMPMFMQWLQGQGCGFHVPGRNMSDAESATDQRIFLDCASRRDL